MRQSSWRPSFRTCLRKKTSIKRSNFAISVSERLYILLIQTVSFKLCHDRCSFIFRFAKKSEIGVLRHYKSILSDEAGKARWLSRVTCWHKAIESAWSIHHKIPRLHLHSIWTEWRSDKASRRSSEYPRTTCWPWWAAILFVCTRGQATEIAKLGIAPLQRTLAGSIRAMDSRVNVLD